MKISKTRIFSFTTTITITYTTLITTSTTTTTNTTLTTTNPAAWFTLTQATPISAPKKHSTPQTALNQTTPKTKTCKTPQIQVKYVDRNSTTACQTQAVATPSAT